jgi:hypothetical protein
MKIRTVKVFLFFVVLTVLSSPNLFSQGLFEQAAGGDEGKPYELNGYLRGTLFVGKAAETDDAEIKSGYGEAALKLRLRKQGFGDAFAEFRFRHGHEFQKRISEIDIREAYVNAYIGPFDFRIGHQIVAWGRADGWNPTDNITPKNMLIRSADEDDRRLANFLIRSSYTTHPFRLEAIWVPAYRPSYIPTDLIASSSGINLVEPDYPDMRLKNGAFALRINMELPSLDGSISYFNGHNPAPGITADFASIVLPNRDLDIFPKSYRLHVVGADFSTVVAGSWGLRGEVAFRQPNQDYEKNVHIPNPDLQYVVGIERELVRNFSLILQYIGRYVFDFRKLEVPENPLEFPRFKIELKNRLIAFQQYEVSHSLSGRAVWELMNELLSLEVFGQVNFTSKEAMVRPKMTYDIADALTFTLGAELYSGPEDTLFDLVGTALSAVFVELKASF